MPPHLSGRASQIKGLQAQCICLRQVIQRCFSGLVASILVAEQVLGFDSAMTPDLFNPDLSLFQETYKIWARHIQNVGCLLGREHLRYWNKGYSVSLPDVAQGLEVSSLKS